MKKVMFGFSAFLACLLSLNGASAQAKIGSFSQEGVLSLFPGIQQKQDTILNKYIIDSLKPEYDYQLSEMVRKDSVFKKDSAKLSAGVRGIMQKEIYEHRAKIVNWQQYQNQMLEQKSNEFLRPYLKKVYEALEGIITEQKYTYVMKEDAFVFPVPLSDNLTVKVAQKLKLLTKEQEEQIKAQESAGESSRPSIRPPARRN